MKFLKFLKSRLRRNLSAIHAVKSVECVVYIIADSILIIWLKDAVISSVIQIAVYGLKR